MKTSEHSKIIKKKKNLKDFGKLLILIKKVLKIQKQF